MVAADTKGREPSAPGRSPALRSPHRSAPDVAASLLVWFIVLFGRQERPQLPRRLVGLAGRHPLVRHQLREGVPRPFLGVIHRLAQLACLLERRKGGARKGNRNYAHGPHIGRERGGNKSGAPRGKPFAQGENSHDGTVHRRGPNELPIIPSSMLKVVAHQAREQRLKRLLGIYDDGANREVLLLGELIGNRIEGLPTKKVERRAFHHSTFLFTTKEGSRSQPLQRSGCRRTSAKTFTASGASSVALSGSGQERSCRCRRLEPHDARHRRAVQARGDRVLKPGDGRHQHGPYVRRVVDHELSQARGAQVARMVRAEEVERLLPH